MFQLIFSIIWMTGYNGATDRTFNLEITIVNEDEALGKQMADQLLDNLPFQMSNATTLDEAKRKLNARDVQMVIHIPADFSEKLQTPGQKGELIYWINESNPALIKSMMTGVSSSVTALVNKQAISAGAQAVLTQMNVPAAQAEGTAESLSEMVTGAVQTMNPVAGMNNQMVPMMLVLASYVGSMIMGMNFQQSSQMIGAAIGRLHKFGARVILNALAALATSFVGASFVLMLGGQTAHGFLELWGFQAICLFTFMLFSQLFVLLLGNAGMLINIIMLSAQLVSSGAMVPRELLSEFYYTLSQYLPATYAVEGNMDLLFGGPGIGGAVSALAVIAAVTFVFGLLVVILKKDKAPALVPAAPKLAN
ncbi:ABC transporter [Paenibacillus sp. 598K]|nr:ABC transporter [Paenibacillus sp. 598K]